MPEQHRHLANNCEDIVNFQGAEAYCVATRLRFNVLSIDYVRVTNCFIIMIIV